MVTNEAMATYNYNLTIFVKLSLDSKMSATANRWFVWNTDAYMVIITFNLVYIAQANDMKMYLKLIKF